MKFFVSVALFASGVFGTVEPLEQQLLRAEGLLEAAFQKGATATLVLPDGGKPVSSHIIALQKLVEEIDLNEISAEVVPNVREAANRLVKKIDVVEYYPHRTHYLKAVETNIQQIRAGLQSMIGKCDVLQPRIEPATPEAASPGVGSFMASPLSMFSSHKKVPEEVRPSYFAANALRDLEVWFEHLFKTKSVQTMENIERLVPVVVSLNINDLDQTLLDIEMSAFTRLNSIVNEVFHKEGRIGASAALTSLLRWFATRKPSTDKTMAPIRPVG